MEEHPEHKWTEGLQASHSLGRAAATEAHGSVHGDVLPILSSYGIINGLPAKNLAQAADECDF